MCIRAYQSLSAFYDFRNDFKFAITEKATEAMGHRN